ncbi:sialidase family protein [Nitrososphaera sp.]|uniref:sialidase family protein n=1 Tax=Nitrososphaera sp. TaxID=1971748 RepID=UPI003178FFF6
MRVVMLLAGLALLSAQPAFALSIVPLEGTDWLEEPVSIGDTGGSPQVAMQGANVYFTWTSSEGLMFSRSTDAGRTFSDPVSLAKPEPHGAVGLEPKVVVDNDNVYILYVHLKDVYLFRSQDGGNSFSGPINVSRTDIDSPAAVASGHTIEAAGNRVYVAWTISNFSWSEIFFARSDDGGRTFGQVRNVSDNPEVSHLPELAVSADNVYLVWIDIDEPTDTQHTSFARSNDHGDTFERITNLSGNPGPYYTFENQVSALGDAVYLVWRDETPGDGGLVFAKSTDGGKTFSFSRVVENGAWPIMSVSRNNVYLTFGVQEHIQGRSVDNVAFVRSTDGGETFSEPLMLSNQTWGLPSPYDARAFPRMSSDGNNVFAAWRYTTNATGTFEVFLATSYDGGERFTVPTVVSTGKGDVSHEAPVLAADNDSVAVVWMEREPDDVQFMLATGTIPPTYTGARDLEPAFMTPVEPYNPPYFLFGIGGVVAGAILGAAYFLRKRGK